MLGLSNRKVSKCKKSRELEYIPLVAARGTGGWGRRQGHPAYKGKNLAHPAVSVEKESGGRLDYWPFWLGRKSCFNVGEYSSGTEQERIEIGFGALM